MRLDYESNSYYGVKNLQKLKKRAWSKPYTSVDDIADTAVHNTSNLILIKQFYYNNDDVELLKLISYLQKIKDESNYRTINKRNWSN